MKTVAVIDFGLSNIDSVVRAIEECGGRPRATSVAGDVEEASSIILPGVGAFAQGMANLRHLGLDVVIREQVLDHGIPLLGLCLGMQLLATRGTEGGPAEGLDLIEGDVVRLVPTGKDTRIPHVGWNEVVVDRGSRLLKGVPSGKDFYFVHSYHLDCRRESDILGRTPYCGGFASVVEHGQVFGVQFHPEKSQRVGFHLLRNFLEL